MGASFNKVLLYVPKAELLLEIVNKEHCIHSVFTGIYVCGDESAFWEGMNADMALRDEDNAGHPAGVFYIIAGKNDNLGLGNDAHAEHLG